MEGIKNKSIVLFMSYKSSLNTWEKSGMLSRESKIWEEFSGYFERGYFFTYGDKLEKRLKGNFKNIELFNNKWGLNPVFYSILGPFLYSRQLCRADIYKVNQASGALPAVIAKIIFRKKLIVRCGYQLSIFFKKQKEHIIKIYLALILEKIAFFFADRIIVTSASDKKYVILEHKVKSSKIEIIPNGIDLEAFRRLDNIEKERGRVLFVGRLTEQKNLFSLLEAFKRIKAAHLVIIGDGYLKQRLIEKVNEDNIKVTFVNKVDNAALPQEYNKAQAFVLPSLFEGNPKVLLEAMACGLPVVGSDIAGINTIILNRHSGLLCAPTPDGLRGAIEQILSDSGLADMLGKNARDYIEENYGLVNLVKKEIEAIN